MIFGFGPAHEDDTRRLVNGLSTALSGADDPQREAEKYALSLGTFKDEDWRIMGIRRVMKMSDYDERGIVVIGVVSHYRDDHPMSPDGIAMMQHEFALTLIDSDDVWEPGSFVAIGKTP